MSISPVRGRGVERDQIKDRVKTMNQPADDIRRQMQSIRRDLADDMDHIAESTREMTEWQSYVKRYPWIALGVAASVGFAVVPKPVEVVRADPAELLKLAKRNKFVVEANPQQSAKSSLAGALLSLAGTVALRGAMAYASQYFSNLSAAAPAGHGRELAGNSGTDFQNQSRSTP